MVLVRFLRGSWVLLFDRDGSLLARPWLIAVSRVVPMWFADDSLVVHGWFPGGSWVLLVVRDVSLLVRSWFTGGSRVVHGWFLGGSLLLVM